MYNETYVSTVIDLAAVSGRAFGDLAVQIVLAHIVNTIKYKAWLCGG